MPTSDTADLVAFDLGASWLRGIVWNGEPRLFQFRTIAPTDMEIAVQSGLNGNSTERIFASLAASVDRDLRVTSWPSRPDWVGKKILDLSTMPGVDWLGSEDDGACAARYEQALLDRNETLAVCSIGTGLGLAFAHADGAIDAGRGERSPAHRTYPGGNRRCRCGRIGCLQTALDTQSILSSGPGDPDIEAALREIVSCAVPAEVRLVFTGGGSAIPQVRATLSEACARLSSKSPVFARQPFWSAAAGALLEASRRIGVEIDLDRFARALDRNIPETRHEG